MAQEVKMNNALHTREKDVSRAIGLMGMNACDVRKSCVFFDVTLLNSKNKKQKTE
jgi:hypothetical protein